MKNLVTLMLIFPLLINLIGCTTQSSNWIASSNSEFSPKQIWEIMEDANGNFWVTTWGHVHFYDQSTDTWSIKLKVNELGLGRSIALALAPDGNVWVGTSSGIGQYNPFSEQWQVLASLDSLPNKDIRAILFDRGGNIWLGTGGSGIYISDDEGSTWHHVTIEKGFSHFTVHKIYQDSRGHIWVAGNALYRYEPEINHWSTFSDGGSRYYSETEVPRGATIQLVGDEEERQRAVEFLQGFDPSITRSELEQEIDPDKWMRPPLETVVLADDYISAIGEDPTGQMWFGTPAGLMKYDPTTSAWTNLTTKDGLADNHVVSMALDASGHIWLGTSNGLSRYNQVSGEWTTFSNEIRRDSYIGFAYPKIFVDSHGKVWVATGSGVYRYNPQP